MPTYLLHEKAAEAFNVRAVEISTAVSGSNPVSREQRAPLVGSAAHRPIAAELTSRDIISALRYTTRSDPVSGELVGVDFFAANGVIRVEGPIARKISALSRDVVARSELRDVCDAEFVQGALLDWLVGEDRDRQGSWSDALLAKVAASVASMTFRVPLAGVDIEAPFEIGPYRLNFFTSADIERMLLHAPEEVRERAKQKYQRTFQGRVCVEGDVTAVYSRATTAALNAAEDVVRALRFVHAAAFDIGVRCGLGVYGRVVQSGYEVAFVTDKGYRRASGSDWPHDGGELFIPQREIPLFLQGGLAAVMAYLAASSHSALQDEAWSALNIFCRGVELGPWRDRLINSLVSAETLMLANETEPVQRSLGQRMATLLGGSLEQKKKLVDDLKFAYAARSGFMHHGEDRYSHADRERLSNVLLACHEVVHFCLKTPTPTKQELIRKIDDALLE